MNRLEIRNLVIDTTGRSDKESLINSAINIALNKVSSSHLWNDLLTEASLTLTVDATSVSIESDVRRLVEVRVLDGLSSYKLRVRSMDWVVKMFPDLSIHSSRKPRYGYLQVTTLHFVPKYDSTYTVKYSYYKLHPDLTNDTTNILILQADEAVIAYATHWVFKSLQLHEDANQWLGLFAVELANAKRADRSSAVEFVADQRGRNVYTSGDYWFDPFVRSVPGYPYY